MTDPNVVVNPSSEPTTQTPPVVDTTVQAPSEPVISDASGDTPANVSTVPITALHEERDKRQALQAKFDRLSQMGVTFDAYGSPVLPRAQAPQQTVDSGTNVVNNTYAQELDKTWEEDPRKAVQMEINAAMTYFDSVGSAVEMQMEEVRSKYKDYANYSKDVTGYIRRMPFAQRSNPGVVEMAYWLVKGQNADTVVANQVQANNSRAFAAGQATGMGTGAGSAPATPAGTVTLTPQQVAVAEAMNLTPAQYASAMKVKK